MSSRLPTNPTTMKPTNAPAIPIPTGDHWRAVLTTVATAATRAKRKMARPDRAVFKKHFEIQILDVPRQMFEVADQNPSIAAGGKIAVGNDIAATVGHLDPSHLYRYRVGIIVQQQCDRPIERIVAQSTAIERHCAEVQC